MSPNSSDMTAPEDRADSARVSVGVRRVVIVLSILVFALAVAGRILGPSDLDQNSDQSKTISFTVDMVLNGNWILPIDMRGEISRKPPLVNWLGAPFFAMGLWEEWAFKMPSLIAALVTFLAIAWIARRLLATIAGDDATPLAWCAAAAWCATPSAIKHMYFLRPDMVLIACTTIAWAAAVESLLRARDGLPRWQANVVFWLFLGLAGLAKGPFALFLFFLIPLTSLAWFGSLGPARGAGWWWGIPLSIAVFAMWFVPALIINQDYVLDVLVRQQTFDRSYGRIDGTFNGVVLQLVGELKLLGKVFVRLAPFSLAVVAALFVWRFQGLRRSGVMPAAVLPVLVVVGLAMFGFTGGSFPAPSYPAAAVLSVAFLYWWGCNRWGRKWLSLIGIVALAFVAVIAVISVRFAIDRGAVSGKGDAVKAFAREARRVVGTEKVIFINQGRSAIPSLMGRHQAGDATPEQRAAAAYLVMNLDETDATPLVQNRSRDGRFAIGLFNGSVRLKQLEPRGEVP